MKILDRYLLFQLFTSLTGSALFMTGLFLMSMLIDNLKYFSHPAVPLDLVLRFLLNALPEILNQILPPAVLFSSSFIFGNLNSSNEIVALNNGGIGFRRLLAPLVIACVLIALASFAFFELVVADCADRAIHLRTEIKLRAGKKFDQIHNRNNFFMMGADRTIYRIDDYQAERTIMINPHITRFRSDNMIEFQLSAATGTFNNGTGQWDFVGVTLITVDRKERIHSRKYPQLSLSLTERPESFMRDTKTVFQMKFAEAMEFIEQKKRTGDNYRRYLVEFQWRFSFPFSIIIVTLIGSIAGIYFRKAVLALSFLLSIVISFAYYGIMAVGLAYGKSGMLHPVVSAWLANAVFLGIAVAILKSKKI